MPTLLMRASLCTLLILPLLAGKTGPVNAGSGKSPLCWGLALDGYPLTDARLESVEREVNLTPPQILVFFLQWPSNAKEMRFPLESLNAIEKRGAVPCITWEPMYYQDGREIAVSHERLLKGDYDSYLISFAKAAKDWRKPLIIRFAHEMNLARYHWGTDKEGYGPKSPQIYKRMFRYVVSAFRKAGASNVLWAFCPNAESLPNLSFDPGSSWNEVANYYPGSDYVDIIGADGYNWGNTQTREKDGWESRWRSFQDLFTSIFAQLRTLSPDKPFFVFETATVTEGGDKELWIREAVRVAGEWNMQGLIWFQVRKEQDWRFNRGVSELCAATVRSELTCSRQWLKQDKH